MLSTTLNSDTKWFRPTSHTGGGWVQLPLSVRIKYIAYWRSGQSHQVHILEVSGSNPLYATKHSHISVGLESSPDTRKVVGSSPSVSTNKPEKSPLYGEKLHEIFV